MFLIETMSKKIGYKIASTLNMDKDHEEIISYGAFSFLQILWSIFITIVFSIIFGIFKEALIIIFTISLLRKYSGGVHASSPNCCAIIGAIISVSIGLIVTQLFSMFNIEVIIIIGLISLIFSYYIIYKLAPVDSPAKPIVGNERKQHLKKCSINIVNIMFITIIILLLFYVKYSNFVLLNIIECIYLGLFWQSFTLTKVGHKILGKIDAVFKYIMRRN